MLINKTVDATILHQVLYMHLIKVKKIEKECTGKSLQGIKSLRYDFEQILDELST